MIVSDELDRLGQLLNEKHINNRHDIWLWLRLDSERWGRRPQANTCNGNTMRDVIADRLENNNRLIALIPRFKDRELLSSQELEWITDDNRQYHWLLSRIEDLTEDSLRHGLVHLIGRSRIVAMIDKWEENIEQKKTKIVRLHELWRRHASRDSKFSWFNDKKEGQKRCLCAWDWIEKHPLSSSSDSLPISNYQELLIFFDKENLRDHELRSCIQGIKMLWSRRQFDERNADKRQVNLMLSHVTINKLDDLVELHGIKRAQIIEKIIKMETEKNLYLTPSEKMDTPK